MHELSAKLMFLDVKIDSYFAHPLIFAQPSAQKLKVLRYPDDLNRTDSMMEPIEHDRTQSNG